MYPSETEFVMPEGTEQNCETFFEEFFLPFLTGIEKDNETIIQDIKTYHEYEKSEETPFYLLEMIKQILIDKNEKFEKYLIIATGKLDKLFETNSVNFFKLFNQNPDYKKALMSSILFLLPYSAEFFQKTGQITCFINLYSTFNLIIGINDSNEVKLINRYINVLFSDLDPHKAIIAMYFASIYKLDEENAEIFSIYITELLKKIPLSNFSENIEFLTYYILFDELNELLSKNFILGMIDIQVFVESADQFFHNFCEKFEENENYEPNQSEIKIIRKISLYCSNFIWYYNSKINYLYTENREQIILICSYFAVLFYKNSYNIILSSKYALTKAIGMQLIWDVEFLINYNGENLILSNMEYFINLLFQLATFVTEDYEEIFESEENFFYDFYDIDFKKCEDYSNRQSLSLFILNSICESKKNGMILFNMIGMALGKLEQSQINEKHFFLVSVLNKVIENITIKDKETLSMLIELTIKYLNYGTEIIDNICDKGLFNELTNIIFIYTFYFLINSSFYLLKMNTELLGDDNSKVYESFNNELYRLMIIIQALTDESAVKNNYCSTLFTFYCILMNNLIDEKKLTINDDSLNEFTTKNFESCFTNHGITLMYKSALVEKNNHLLLQAFFQYYEHCQTMISELIDLLKQRSGKDESEEEDFEVRSDRESDYILRFFSDNVFNMSTIIKIVGDFSIFDKEKLQNFAVFLISKGSDKWPFVDECIHFMSAILIKTDNIKDWIGLYMSNVVKSSRIDSFYGEYIIPIINAVSYQPDQIDQPFFDYLVNLIKENMVNLTGDLYGEENRKYMATCDALMSFAFIIRLFEITILDEIKMSTQDVEFFIKFAIDIQPTEKDLEFSDDIVVEDQELGTNILKLASFLTISNPNFEDIFALFSKLLEEGQIVCNETRYIIIYLIDNVIKVEDMSQLKKLRELCLNNKIQYNSNYREFYVADIKYFVGDVIHPIYKIYPIEGFVVDDYQNFDFDEDSKDDENENDN